MINKRSRRGDVKTDMRQTRYGKFIIFFAVFAFVGFLRLFYILKQNDADNIRNNVSNITFEELIKNINDAHKQIEKPEIDYESYLCDITVDGMNEEQISSRESFSITSGQMEEDVDRLFEEFRTRYGLYSFYGEDTFEEARKKIIAECSLQTELTNDLLAESLLRHLSFIEDNHLFIDGRQRSEITVSVIYEKAMFFLDKEGGVFRNLKNQKILVSVDGDNDVKSILRPFISDNGQIVYCPIIFQKGALGELQSTCTMNTICLKYTDGSEEIVETEPWSENNILERSGRTGVSLHENAGIPVLVLNKMEDKSADLMLQYARALREEPILIIDLRWNKGGKEDIVYRWWSTYTDSRVDTNFFTIGRKKLSLTQYGRHNMGNFKIVGEYRISTMDEVPMADNHNVVFILTSKNTASAAEIFVDIAFNVKNTVVVGENTFGVLRGNMSEKIRLENSGIFIQFGDMLNIFPSDTYFTEGVGFQPDIWSYGKDAEERTIKLIEYYVR